MHAPPCIICFCIGTTPVPEAYAFFRDGDGMLMPICGACMGACGAPPSKYTPYGDLSDEWIVQEILRS